MDCVAKTYLKTILQVLKTLIKWPAFNLYWHISLNCDIFRAVFYIFEQRNKLKGLSRRTINNSYKILKGKPAHCGLPGILGLTNTRSTRCWWDEPEAANRHPQTRRSRLLRYKMKSDWTEYTKGPIKFLLWNNINMHVHNQRWRRLQGWSMLPAILPLMWGLSLVSLWRSCSEPLLLETQ